MNPTRQIKQIIFALILINISISTNIIAQNRSFYLLESWSVNFVEDEEWGEIVPEGVEAVVPYRGSVDDILHQFIGGLRSGMSYAGVRTIEAFWDESEFIRITPAGKAESGVHDVDLL